MEIRTIAVIGSGTMGRGIAHVAALAGYATRLHDVAPAALESARAAIAANLRQGVEKGKVAEGEMTAALERLHLESDLTAAGAGADLVIEAVPEKPALKQEVFAALDRACVAETILASNTSSLSIGALAAAVSHPERFCGMHFFNPPHIMRLLEIVRGAQTADATIAAARRVAERMGKEAIVVTDSPGFATSRLGVCLGLEAIRMLEQGVASAEDIDTALVLGYRHPMGPLRLTDLIGLDVRLAIAEYLHQTLQSEVFRPPDLLREMVAEGRLGQKAGRGFFDWENPS